MTAHSDLTTHPSLASRALRSCSSPIRSLIETALLAPSGDNCQPWRFRLTEAGFDLRFDAPRAEALLDAGDLASRFSAGALLETALLAGRAMGLEVGWQLDPHPGDPGLWARVVVGPRLETAPLAAPDADLAEAIGRRRTCREPFAAEALPGEALDQLKVGLEPGEPGVRLSLIASRAAIRAAAELAAAAERTRAQLPRAHDDLHRWIRWSAEEAEATRDGLDVRSLGASALERSMLRVLRPWSRARWIVALGGARAMGAHSRRLVRASGALALISVAEPSTSAAVGAGRVAQRLWLRATHLGLAASPLAALPLLLLRAERLGGEGLTERQAARLRRLGSTLRAVFGLPEREAPLFLLRLGHPLRSTDVRALRRRAEEVIES